MFYEVVDENGATIALCRNLGVAQYLVHHYSGCKVLGEIPNVTIHVDAQAVSDAVAHRIEAELRKQTFGSTLIPE